MAEEISKLDAYFEANDDIKHVKVQQEIIQTEEDYIKDLSILINHYKYNFIQKGFDKLVKHIFGNIEEILEFNKKLIECLIPNVPYIDLFSNVFTTRKNQFVDIYGKYCKDYNEVNETIKKIKNNLQGAQFLEKMSKDAGHKLPLASFLIKPVQRILRYSLLLKSLSKSYVKIYGENEELNNAVKAMDEVAQKINDLKKENEETKRFKYFKVRCTNICEFLYSTIGQYITEYSVKLNKLDCTLVFFSKYTLIDDNSKTFKTALHIIPNRRVDIEFSEKFPNQVTLIDNDQKIPLKTENSIMAKDIEKTLKKLKMAIIKKILNDEDGSNETIHKNIKIIDDSDDISNSIDQFKDVQPVLNDKYFTVNNDWLKTVLAKTSIDDKSGKNVKNNENDILNKKIFYSKGKMA